MPRQQLNVAHGSARVMHEPRCTGDEGPAARMGRASLKANNLERPIELDDDAERGHRAASLGPNYMPWLSPALAPSRQGVGKIRMNWYQPTAALLCRVVTKLDDVVDLAGRIDHHVPRQVCDLAGTHSGFRRQQDNHSVADRVSGAIGEDQKIRDIFW
jgi:hypothetical protein